MLLLRREFLGQLLTGISSFASQAQSFSGMTSATTRKSACKVSLPIQRSLLLSYSPPKQIDPTYHQLTTSFQSLVFRADEDVVLLPPLQGRSLESNLQVSGGRHIRLIGVTMDGRSGNGSRVAMANASGSYFIEGCKFDMGSNEDVINLGSTNGCEPDVYLQNIYETGAFGTERTNHTDFFQASGRIGSLYMDKLTFDSDYQGIFLSGEFGQRMSVIKRVNARYKDYGEGNKITYLLWFGTTDVTISASSEKKLNSIIPTYVSEVYIEPKQGQNLASDAVQPMRGATLNGISVGAIPVTDGVEFPAFMHIGGEIKTGPPPFGDFVDPQSVGTGYVSPGYQN